MGVQRGHLQGFLPRAPHTPQCEVSREVDFVPGSLDRKSVSRFPALPASMELAGTDVPSLSSSRCLSDPSVFFRTSGFHMSGVSFFPSFLSFFTEATFTGRALFQALGQRWVR